MKNKIIISTNKQSLCNFDNIYYVIKSWYECDDCGGPFSGGSVNIGEKEGVLPNCN